MWFWAVFCMTCWRRNTFLLIPERIKLIPEGLYPDYPPSFSPRNISGWRNVETLICIVRVKKSSVVCSFFGFFYIFFGFWRISVDFSGFSGFWIICLYYGPNQFIFLPEWLEHSLPIPIIKMSCNTVFLPEKNLFLLQ